MTMSRLLRTLGYLVVVEGAVQRYAFQPLAPTGLMPRYMLDKSSPLLKRDGLCNEGHHPCLDVGWGSQCCDNDSYCYIKTNGDLSCCPIGSNCKPDSNCNSDKYATVETTTKSGTRTTQQSCANRKCSSTSNYLCPSSLGGGNCCLYGWDCQSGGNCVQTQTPSRTPQLTAVASGCTTSQHKCADGSGCCYNYQHCTDVSNTGYCALGNPSDTSVSIVNEPSSSGLSSGAKAGIAIGVIIGVGLIFGVAAWLCVSRRRRRRTSHPSRSSGRPGEEMSEMSTQITRSQPGGGGGLTQDYFGPNPVSGPYTEPRDSAATSPGPGRAVPSLPQSPGDIAAPVEIDSKGPKDEAAKSGSPESQLESPSALGHIQSIEGRFELYGSDANTSHELPSPMLTTPLTPRSEPARISEL